MKTSLSRLARALLSPIPLLVLVIVSAAAVLAFVLLGHAAAEQERRLLTERADEAAIIVSNGMGTVNASLSSLAAIGDTGDEDVAALFDQLAGPRIAGRTTAVGLASPTPDGFAITEMAGQPVASASDLDPAFEALLARAASLDEPALVTDVVGAGDMRRTIYARTAGADTVAFQESIASDQPADLGLNSAFADLRAALFASPDASLDSVVLTTDEQIPVDGIAGVTTRPIAVGADTWKLTVGARTPLIGPLTAAMPWVALIAGLIAGLLAAIIAAGLLRRNEYAERIAEERTRSLAATLDELAGTRAFLPTC